MRLEMNLETGELIEIEDEVIIIEESEETDSGSNS